MGSQFQLYKDNAGEFRWRLLANNHEVIAQSSEGYSDKSAARRGAEILKEKGLSGSPEVYQDGNGKFRFRYTSPNGNIIAVGQSYKNEDDASHAVSLLHQLAPAAPIVETDD